MSSLRLKKFVVLIKFGSIVLNYLEFWRTPSERRESALVYIRRASCGSATGIILTYYTSAQTHVSSTKPSPPYRQFRFVFNILDRRQRLIFQYPIFQLSRISIVRPTSQSKRRCTYTYITVIFTHLRLFMGTIRAGELNPDHTKAENYRDDNGEVFSEARDTEGDPPATADGSEADTHEAGANEVGAIAEHGLDPSLGAPVAGLPSAQAGFGGAPGAERAEEWCAGHVCLRLRPDGLREKPGDGGEEGGEESSEDGSGNGSGSEEGGQREVRLYVCLPSGSEFFSFGVTVYIVTWS